MKFVLGTALLATLALGGTVPAFQDPPVCACTDNGASWLLNPDCPEGASPRAVTDNLSCVGATGGCTLSGSVTVTWADGCDYCVHMYTTEGNVGNGPEGFATTSAPTTINVLPAYTLTCGNNLSVVTVDFYDNVFATNPNRCTGSVIAVWRHNYHCSP